MTMSLPAKRNVASVSRATDEPAPGDRPTPLRYVYLTADFVGSGALLRGLAVRAGGPPTAVVVSAKPRGWSFVRRMLYRSGIRYLAYLAAIGAVHRTVQWLLRPSAAVSGRSKGISQSARELGAEILRVGDVREDDAIRQRVGALEPDLLCSVFFDQRLPVSWLAIPSLGAVNVHNSLLPRYAGSAPTVAALADGCDRVGVTLHEMNAEFDAGPIIAQRSMSVKRGASVLGVDRRLMEIGIDLLGARLASEATADWRGVAQDARARSYRSHPSRDVVRELRRRGYRLITLRDYVKCCME